MKNIIKYLFLLLPAFGFCQSNLVMGRVTDKETGEALEFANITILGTTEGCFTDINGNFKIEIPQKQVFLIASFMGYFADTLAWETGDFLKFNLRKTATSLGEVVISGTLKEVSKMNSPVAVEVYTPKFFLRNPTPSLFDAMQQVNGVRPQLNCNVCNTGDIHINGMEGPYTLVLIDGIPIVSGLSTVYGLSGIPNAIVERIEVVKGPAATIYGSEAVGGLINIITKNPVNAPRFSLDLGSTSFLENNLDLSAARHFGKWSSLASANYFYFGKKWDTNADNFTDVTLQNRLSVFNKWSLQRKNNRQTNFAFRYVWEDRFGGEMQFEPILRGSDSIYGEFIRTNRYELVGNYELPTREKILLNYSINQHEQQSAYGTTLFDAKQQIGFAQLTWNKNWRRHDILSGAALRYTFYDDNTPITADTLLQNAPNQTWLPGIFVQDEIELTKKVKIMPGLRYDFSNTNGSIFTPRTSLKFTPNELNTLRLTYGSGYRVVYVFSEEHAALTGSRKVEIKNDLKPERSQNININYVTKFFPEFGFIGLDASLFYTFYNNKIVADFTTDPDKVIFDNLAEYGISRGMTLNTDFNFTNGLKLIAGFTAMNVFTINKTNTGEKQQIPQLHAPKLTANWSLSYTIPKWNLTLDYTGTLNSPMHLPVQKNDFRPDESPWFSIQNIQFSKKWKNGIEVYSGVKNLLNFVPEYSLMRPFDPFDKTANDPISNPNGYTFDTSYNYAQIQGIKGFLGIRYILR